MARIAELLYRGKVVNAEASRRMIEILKLVQADFRAAIPANVAVASKPGGLTGVHAETGIVYVAARPFVISVCSTFLDETDNPVRAIAREVYDHFAKLARSNRFGHSGVK